MSCYKMLPKLGNQDILHGVTSSILKRSRNVKSDKINQRNNINQIRKIVRVDMYGTSVTIYCCVEI